MKDRQTLLTALGLFSFVLFSTPVFAQAGNGEAAWAESLLRQLEGSWRFALFARGAEQARRHGERRFSPSHNPLALDWSEHIEGTDIHVRGVLGFDAQANVFYEFGLASEGPGEFRVGHRRSTDNAVVFSDNSADATRARTRLVLELIDEDRFVFEHQDIERAGAFPRWRAVFERIEESGARDTGPHARQDP